MRVNLKWWWRNSIPTRIPTIVGSNSDSRISLMDSMRSESAYFPDVMATAAKYSEALPTVSENPACSSTNASELMVGSAAKVFEISDEQLLDQVRDGESEALTLLFRRHARAVWNVSYRILRDAAEAGDLVQEVFLFVFRNASLLNPTRGAAGTQIIRVADHRAFDRWRYLNSRNFYANKGLEDAAFRLADPRKEVSFPEQSVEGVLGKRMMARYNATLSCEQRETIQLYFFGGTLSKKLPDSRGGLLST
jgi:RNA polymerase sigma-70 factor (ECF subfamily)